MQGYVYILVNSAFPGLVKIGKTARAPDLRARDLHGTGVPSPFIVAYSELVEDCDSLEQQMHAELQQHRASDRREFFRISCQDAITLLQAKAVGQRVVATTSSNPLPPTVPPNNHFYVAAIRPVTSDGSLLFLRREVFDNPSATQKIQASSMQALEFDETDNSVSLNPARAFSGACRLYRFGFTSLTRSDLDSQLRRYLTLLEVLCESSCISYEDVATEFDWQPVAQAFAPSIVSFREQLILADDKALLGFKEAMLAQAVATYEQQEAEVARLQSDAEMRMLSDRL